MGFHRYLAAPTRCNQYQPRRIRYSTVGVMWANATQTNHSSAFSSNPISVNWNPGHGTLRLNSDLFSLYSTNFTKTTGFEHRKSPHICPQWLVLSRITRSTLWIPPSTESKMATTINKHKRVIKILVQKFQNFASQVVSVANAHELPVWPTFIRVGTSKQKQRECESLIRWFGTGMRTKPVSI